MTRKTPSFVARLEELKPTSRARAEIFECPECDGLGEDEETGRQCPACGGSCVRVVMVPVEEQT
jgi:hypothetical protein